MEYIRRADRDNIRLQLDIFPCPAGRWQSNVFIEKNYKEYIGHIQIASVPARREPIDGEVDYQWIFAVLEQEKNMMVTSPRNIVLAPERKPDCTGRRPG